VTPDDIHNLAHVLTGLDQRVTMLASALRGMRDHETLVIETIVIPASGVVDRDWQVEYHAVAVTSQSTQAVTLSSSPSASSAPPSGVGVAVIGPNRCGVFNLCGYSLSVYGKPGDTVTLEVLAKPQPPAWGA
jgi:hypothetical protein